MKSFKEFILGVLSESFSLYARCGFLSFVLPAIVGIYEKSFLFFLIGSASVYVLCFLIILYMDIRELFMK